MISQEKRTKHPILQNTNNKMRWKRRTMSGVLLEALSIDIMSKSDTFCMCLKKAHESEGCRIQESRNSGHEDHIADRGKNSMIRYNLVHKTTHSYPSMNEFSGCKVGQIKELASLVRIQSKKPERRVLSKNKKKERRFNLRRLRIHVTLRIRSGKSSNKTKAVLFSVETW